MIKIKSSIWYPTSIRLLEGRFWYGFLCGLPWLPRSFHELSWLSWIHGWQSSLVLSAFTVSTETFPSPNLLHSVAPSWWLDPHLPCGSDSVLARFGSRKILLLLHDSSHGSHFSTCQNMEPEEFLEKKSNFSLRRFSIYLTPNMALQNIILTSFFFFLPGSRGMRSPSHNFLKILSNRNEILQTCSGVNVVVPNIFWVHSV